MPAGEPAKIVAEANLTEEPPDQGNQPEWADVIAEEKAYYREQEFSKRVKEDALEEVTLGTGEEEKPVKISTDLEPDFKQQLVQLLTEYKDVFAWSYQDMKGLDTKSITKLCSKPMRGPFGNNATA